MITIAELFSRKTAQQLFDALLADLGARGFPVTAWQTAGAGRTLAFAIAALFADLYATVQLLALSAFLDTAEGAWLSLLAASMFSLTRIPSSFAVGDVRLTCASSAGPYQIQPAGLVVSDGTRRWRSTNTGMVTVPSGATATFRVMAESPGSAWNAPVDTIDTIVTPALAGLTVNNPARSGSTTWLTVNARDEETDAELRIRCRARWATLASGFPIAAVVFWALSATLDTGVSAGVTRVHVEPGGGDGSYDVVIASSNGAVGSDVVTAVETALAAKKPITDEPNVVSAIAHNVHVIAQVFAVGGLSSGQIDELNTRLLGLASETPIEGVLYLSDVYGVLTPTLTDGTKIDHVALAAPVGNTVLGSREVLKIIPTVTSGSV